jgi:hypothetical protein
MDEWQDLRSELGRLNRHSSDASEFNEMAKRVYCLESRVGQVERNLGMQFPEQGQSLDEGETRLPVHLPHS